jgi:hypothetical protein
LENNIRIEFGLNTLANADKNKYRYKIEELNSTWSNCQDEGFIDLKGLSGGRFTVHVQGKDAIVGVSNEAKFAFYVQPPFFKSGYAYLWYGCG